MPGVTPFMIGSDDFAKVLGSTLYGPHEEPIGVIGHVYLDGVSSRPIWLTVHTGLFGTHESFLPVAGARIVDEGVLVGFSRDLVRDAPRVDPADGQLTEADEDLLFRHYGLSPDVGSSASHVRRFGDPVDDVIDVRNADDRPLRDVVHVDDSR